MQYINPDSYGRQHCVFLVLQGCSTRGPGAQLSAECWFSLLHLISKFSGPQLNQGPWEPLRSCVDFSTTLVSYSNSNWSLAVWLLSWLNYIIVQRPLNLPLNLWNGMFDRHQAEITVMQFTGHSLPVHHSEVGPSLVPYYQPNSPARFLLITAIGMCHFLPVHHFEWHFWLGRMSKYNTNGKEEVTHTTQKTRTGGSPPNEV